MVAPSPFRSAIVECANRGMTSSEIVKKLGVGKSVVNRTLIRFKELKTLKDKKRSGRPVSVMTPDVVKAVRERIRRNPERSMRKMSTELGMSATSMRRIVRNKLKMIPSRIQKSASLTDRVRPDPNSNVKMAELFAGKPLINQEGEEIDAKEALEGKKIIALYFSAMWCGSCRQFTPKLKRFYEALKKEGKSIEIVLVSRDRGAEDLLEYLGHGGDWLAIPFGDERIQEYLKKYEVPTIPAFKLINNAGELLHDARADVTERGKDEPVAVFDEWAEKFPAN